MECKCDIIVSISERKLIEVEPKWNVNKIIVHFRSFRIYIEVEPKWNVNVEVE